MESDFISYSSPDIGGEELDEVSRVMRSGWLTSGPKVKEFEESFSRFLGESLYCIAVNSATAGLHLALEAIGIEPGDEVITTTHTFTATAEVVRYLGAKVILIDIDPISLTIDTTLLERNISNRTKAVVPVHFAGRAANMNEVLRIAKRHKISVVEDAAHALPTTCEGQMIGTLESDATVFSFYANKTMTTGEGGMVVTRNPDIADRVRLMRSHGIDRNAFDRYTSREPGWFYQVIAPGYKYNLTDIAAAIGLVQLKKVRDFQVRRQEIAEYYNNSFVGLPLITPPGGYVEGDLHSWHLYVLRLPGANRDRTNLFMQKLYSSGIGCSVHYIPLHLHPYWRQHCGVTEDDFPVSQAVYHESLSLPIYNKLTDGQVRRIVDEVRRVGNW